MNEDTSKLIKWRLAQEEWNAEQLRSLSSYILNFGRCLQRNDVMLALNALCTNLEKC